MYLQKTLKKAINCSGIGVHTGARIHLNIKPAEVGTGIVFHRTDVAGRDAFIPANYLKVVDTKLCTCIGNKEGISVSTIEHIMAAFHAMSITNAIVDIDGPEVPILDGSAYPFLFLMECAGIEEQAAPLKAIRILKEVSVTEKGGVAKISPATKKACLTIECEIEYPNTVIGTQGTKFVSSDNFKNEVSRARTFGLLKEIDYLRSIGLAKGGTLENAVVIGNDGQVMNPEGLRFADEFSRHKVLDAFGDLYTSGYTLIGNFRGTKSGHSLNNLLLRQLLADDSAYEMVDLSMDYLTIIKSSPKAQVRYRGSEIDFPIAAGE